ncbi:MAG: flagellar protein FlaG, partial [Agathobacter sp.]|nr:flagellar protein FlaG [Agathobacter sp.]
MAVIEGISGAGMTYQGSVSTVQTKAEAQPKIENAGNEIASKEIAKETMNLSAKEASNDGSSDANSNQAAQQQMDKNKQLRKAVEDINKSAAGSQSEAIFGIHEKTNRVTIKI